MKFFFSLFALIWSVIYTNSIYAQAIQKHRLIVLSDIEADPDDSQSFVRLLLYANVIDIEGMIATTSVWQKTRIAPKSIKKIIQAYGKVQPNLLKHEPGFPEAASAASPCKARSTKIWNGRSGKRKRYRGK